MPGFDRSGPQGMGPMTGGARGLCNSRRRDPVGRDLGSQFRGGRGRPRGNRNMSGVPGRSGGRRLSPMGFQNDSFDAPYDRDQEMGFLKEQATALRQELKAIDRRLKDLESG